MASRKTYGSYSPWIKAAIALSGKVDLFPHLKIPRTTAQHWIDQGYVQDDQDNCSSSMLNALVDDLAKARRELEAAHAVIELLKSVFSTMGFKLRWKHVGSAETREKILSAVETAMRSTQLATCLDHLDLSLSRYKRWLREKRGCGLPSIKMCPKGNRLNQLTFEEIQTMRYYVTSIEFSYFPIRSLNYFAKRQGKLFCSYSTWTKYIDQYKWLRPRKIIKEKRERVGIRAKHPNELWHMDVSHFVLPSGKKCYIQAIIDNYSRYVVAWQVLESYDGSKTASLLKAALEKVQIPFAGLSVMVDGGGENKSRAVKKLEDKGNFKKVVAQFEISFSNSIVEALFRQLKNNYLYHKAITSHQSLNHHASFWFKQHNEVIPHTSFKGETPLERFTHTWDQEEEIRILVRQKDAVKLRIESNQKVFCELCKAA